jgi:hypothetical protein
VDAPPLRMAIKGLACSSLCVSGTSFGARGAAGAVGEASWAPAPVRLSVVSVAVNSWRACRRWWHGRTKCCQRAIEGVNGFREPHICRTR